MNSFWTGVMADFASGQSEAADPIAIEEKSHGKEATMRGHLTGKLPGAGTRNGEER